MNLYGYNRDLKIIELGPCDEVRALEELKLRYAAGFQKYEYGEEAIEKTSFGLARSEADFIDASCSLESVMFQSDRLVYPQGFSRFFDRKSHLVITVGATEANEVIRNFYRMSRADFESTYKKFLRK